MLWAASTSGLGQAVRKSRLEGHCCKGALACLGSHHQSCQVATRRLATTSKLPPAGSARTSECSLCLCDDKPPEHYKHARGNQDPSPAKEL